MSTQSEERSSIPAVITLVAVAFMAGFCIGGGIASSIYQHGAIENGHAEYNSVNGQWQWKVSK